MTEELEITPISEFTEAPLRNRITMRLEFSHESEDAGPASLSLAFSSRLKSSEQMYSRKTTLNKGSTIPLDTGWIPKDEVGMVLISNDTARAQPMMKPEEREALENDYLLELFAQGSPLKFSLRPGEFMLLRLNSPEFMELTAPHADVKYSIHALPK